MVWNKTPDDVVEKIIYDLKHTDRSCKAIGEKYNVSEYTVGNISRANLSTYERHKRKVAQDRLNKIGDKNPMKGKTGRNHHNSVEISRCAGYRQVFKPSWWTGKSDGNRIYEHHLVYCQYHGLTELPKGHVIHHIDGNVDNNHISNLVLLTTSDHVKLHWQLRKEQRLSSNGVGNSVPEAHGTLI